tara:strand:- start:340 stop:552 length:213 start_codon:yes stop_codon:yes gene_type:complete
MSKETTMPKEVRDKLIAYNRDLIEMIPNITNEELLECLTMVCETAFKEGAFHGINEVKNMVKKAKSYWGV